MNYEVDPNLTKRQSVFKKKIFNTPCSLKEFPSFYLYIFFTEKMNLFDKKDDYNVRRHFNRKGEGKLRHGRIVSTEIWKTLNSYYR